MERQLTSLEVTGKREQVCCRYYLKHLPGMKYGTSSGMEVQVVIQILQLLLIALPGAIWGINMDGSWQQDMPASLA